MRLADAAATGSRETFEAWWAFSEGKGAGCTFLALAVAVIAGSEARSLERATPSWAAWVATAAGVASFSGWALGMWMGVRVGNLLWVIASIVMSAWTLWFGSALARRAARGG